MSKHQLLTEVEFAKFSPPKRTLHYLEEFCLQSGRRPEQVNVLEWGCGRGRETLWLRQCGYNAFGVDPDPVPLRNAAPLFVAKGQDPSALRVLGAPAESGFPAGYFHFTYSNQVFEHIADLRSVANELWRITAAGGAGHHVYPAYRYIVEGHLFMPFIHWLPKNSLRKGLIGCYVRLGREPHWPELAQIGRRERTERYYRYSVNKTFYRSPSDIERTFATEGFDVRYETINHPRVSNHAALGPVSRSALLRPVLNRLLLTFISNELHLLKPADGATGG